MAASRRPDAGLIEIFSVRAQNDSFAVARGKQTATFTAWDFFRSGENEAEVLNFKRYKVTGKITEGKTETKFTLILRALSNVIRITCNESSGKAEDVRAHLNAVLPLYLGAENLLTRPNNEILSARANITEAIERIRELGSSAAMSCRCRDVNLVANILHDIKDEGAISYTLHPAPIVSFGKKLLRGAAEVFEAAAQAQRAEEAKKKTRPNSGGL